MSTEIKMPTEISTKCLDVWCDAIASGDPQNVVSLFAKDAVLLGTFSNETRTTPALIKDYFIQLLNQNPALRVEIIKVESIRLSESGKLGVLNGLYDFISNVDGKENIMHARFTFVLESTEEGVKVHSQHSSLVPE